MPIGRGFFSIQAGNCQPVFVKYFSYSTGIFWNYKPEANAMNGFQYNA